jgi:hypothetical protein
LKRISYLILIISLVGLVLSGCSSSQTQSSQINLNKPFDLAVGSTAQWKQENVSIKFHSVTSDSRCPEGTKCIWAGQAKFIMQVTQNEKTRDVELIQTGSSLGASVDLVERYTVSFTLLPYPKAGKSINPDKYVLNMKIYQ